MSEVIVSVLDFIIKSNIQNPGEMVFIFTIIGCVVYYFFKIKPEKDKKEYDLRQKRDALEERRLSEAHRLNNELHSDIVKQSELLKSIQSVLTSVDKTLDDIHDTLITHDERSKVIDSENKRFHDTMSKKTDFDKIETKIENIQHDIAVIKALINNNR